jgi:tungstate transport system substrate-binding protein
MVKITNRVPLKTAVQALVITLATALQPMDSGSSFAASEISDVLLATTTSTNNSGLTDYLLPQIQADTGFAIKVISVGTGKALQMGRAGDVDMLLVHAKNAELKFIMEGYGVDRTELMYNDFVLVGPANDPAGVRQQGNMIAALNAIADQEYLFVSRGDDSGTHKKEISLWSEAEISPGGEWYREVGQGMGKTLLIADELSAYTLTDRGTWIFTEDRSSLEIVFEGEPLLLNQYSAIAINPDRHKVNYEGARAVIEWLVSEKGQGLIDSYRIGDKKLFHANAR